MPGNQGGSNWGSTAANPADGSVYVIGFNVPTIIRLLKPGEMRAGRRGGPPEMVKEGRYVTDGFGLYPTIVNPPYTTLTAYDLNKGTIKWQIGLGDDLRLVGQGVTGTGTAATHQGRDHRHRDGTRCSSRPPIARSTSTTAPPASRCAEFQLGGPTSWSAVDVRAWRTAVPPGHGVAVAGGRGGAACRRPRDPPGSWPTPCRATERLLSGAHSSSGTRRRAPASLLEPAAHLCDAPINGLWEETSRTNWCRGRSTCWC